MPASLLHQAKPLALALLLPPAPFLLLIATGAILLSRAGRRPIWGQMAIGLGVLGVWLSASPALGQLLSRGLLQQPAALSATDMTALGQRQRAQADVAVLVLGGGARQDVPEYGGAALNEISFDRLRYGVWLARRIQAPLGFSGGIGWTARRLKDSEASIAERTASEEFALPLRWAEGHSRDTRENAALSLQMLKADGIRKIVLVTHEQHMHRALKAFHAEAKGEIEIIAAPVGLLQDGMSELLDWAPSDEGFARVRYAVYEWLGLRLGR
ncbi:MAG: YdcF family protein [Paucibacter sp.]|nr:YdcF family protein [Roseateles sp.]